ncbi:MULTISPECIES: transcription antitermination factor NusB [Sporomusaceae]|jgi:N utilization substance protein B|uniref:transcription antitermination factor NusB n=1 Tax=Sporomusaceae TaxID=1843490 RepID=UPI000379B2CF|nr:MULTISPECIES: transcription antitermination factor NusB [Sporomusaceae]
MSRRLARELAMQALYQLDFQTELEPLAALEAAAFELEVTPDAVDYAKRLVEGICAHSEQIDQHLSSTSSQWKLERMAAVDRNISRIAVYELLFGEEEMTPGIVINEAVEIAKKYGDKDSARFINGVLGSLAKTKESS